MNKTCLHPVTRPKVIDDEPGCNWKTTACITCGAELGVIWGEIHPALTPPSLPYAYVCPDCSGLVKRTIIEDQPGNEHLYQWICKSCYREFGPAWSSCVWGIRDGTILLGLEEVSVAVKPTQVAVIRRFITTFSFKKLSAATIVAAGTLFIRLFERK
jgi:hypothetical protein